MNEMNNFPLLRELVHRLPPSAEWTKAHRDAWLLTMENTVDLIMLERSQRQREEKRVVLLAFWNFVRGE